MHIRQTLLSLLLLAGVFVGAYAVQCRTESICRETISAINEISTAEPPDSARLSEMMDCFTKRSNFLTLFFHHTPIDSIRNGLEQALYFIENGDFTQANSILAGVTASLEALAERDRLNGYNIF